MAGWTAIAKTRKTNRVRPNMRAQKLFTDRPPEYGLQVSNRRWLPVSDTHHISPECDLRTGCEAFSQRNVLRNNQQFMELCPVDRQTGSNPITGKARPGEASGWFT